jgi:hypothetical protein
VSKYAVGQQISAAHPKYDQWWVHSIAADADGRGAGMLLVGNLEAAPGTGTGTGTGTSPLTPRTPDTAGRRVGSELQRAASAAGTAEKQKRASLPPGSFSGLGIFTALGKGASDSSDELFQRAIATGIPPVLARAAEETAHGGGGHRPGERAARSAARSARAMRRGVSGRGLLVPVVPVAADE